MLTVTLNDQLESSTLPAGEKLAARCAIGALDLLKAVAATYSLTLDEMTPEHISDYCIAGGDVEVGHEVARAIVVTLPEPVRAVWADRVGTDADFFGQYAVTSWLLREGWIEPDDAPLLPFKVIWADGLSYQLAPDAEAAADMARAEGVAVVGTVDRGW